MDNVLNLMIIIGLLFSFLGGPIFITALFFLFEKKLTTKKVKTISKRGHEIVSPFIIFLITIFGFAINFVLQILIFYVFSNHVMPDDVRCGTGLMMLALFIFCISVVSCICTGILVYSYNES